MNKSIKFLYSIKRIPTLQKKVGMVGENTLDSWLFRALLNCRHPRRIVSAVDSPSFLYPYNGRLVNNYIVSNYTSPLTIRVHLLPCRWLHDQIIVAELNQLTCDASIWSIYYEVVANRGISQQGIGRQLLQYRPESDIHILKFRLKVTPSSGRGIPPNRTERPPGGFSFLAPEILSHPVP